MHLFNVGLEKIYSIATKCDDSDLNVKFNKGIVSLKLKENTVPKFFKPRPLPFAIKEKVEKEILNLVELGVLEPIEYSEWGTPIVAVLKKNGQVRICGDYKITLNPFLRDDPYSIPRIEDLLAKLHGGKHFSKLDLSMAYQQLCLDETSKELTTISTTKGLFRYTRLVYGLKSAPAIFQRIIDSLLYSIEGVVVFMDDILITASTREQHLERLETVLGKLADAGLKVSKDKCEFFAESVSYLGYTLDSSGLRTCPEKVKAIVETKHHKM